MKYRERLYERYATVVMNQTGPLALDAADRWGASYDTYFRHWLPAAKDAAIVDLACGSGGLLRFFTKRGYTQVIGVDISPEQVALARQVHDRVERANIIEFLKDKQGEFDLITGLDVIEHLTRDEGLDLLDAAAAALRPRGRLILQLPNMDSPWGLTIRYADNTHEIGYNPKSLGQLLGLAGLTNIESRETGPVPHGLKSTVRWGLWKLCRLRMTLFNLIETGSPGSRVFTRVFLISGVRGALSELGCTVSWLCDHGLNVGKIER